MFSGGIEEEEEEVCSTCWEHFSLSLLFPEAPEAAWSGEGQDQWHLLDPSFHKGLEWNELGGVARAELCPPQIRMLKS